MPGAPAAPEVPDEMFVDPRMLKVLADKQDQGLAFYGECVYPPWKRQRKTAGGAKALSRLQLAQLSSQYVSPMMPPDTRKSTKPKATGKKERRESNKGPFTQEENAIILLEKEKGSSWEKIANSLICRTAWIVKKHYNNNLLPQTQQPKPQQPVPAAPEGAADGVLKPRDPGGQVVPVHGPCVTCRGGRGLTELLPPLVQSLRFELRVLHN